MLQTQFEICIDTIPPSLTHIYSTNKQKINAKQNNMQTLGKLTHVSDATRPQLVRV